MEVFQAKNYRDFLHYCLKGEGRLYHGAIKDYADEIRSHPSYISQVISEKADLSLEQGVGFCSFMRMNRDETDYFINLLSRDRSGTKSTKQYFSEKLKELKSAHSNLKKRIEVKDKLPEEIKARYFSDWIPQTIHMYCHIKKDAHIDSIANDLKLPVKKVEGVVNFLVDANILKKDGGRLEVLVDSNFLDKNDPYVEKMHQNWRLRTIYFLQHNDPSLGFHFSGLVTIDKKTAEEIKESIIKLLQKNTQTLSNSKEEELYAYCIDFYPQLV